jgi:hypothetical protein
MIAKERTMATSQALRASRDDTYTIRPIEQAQTIDIARPTAAQSAVQVNVWRPITGPVRRSPLALADARTVQQNELIATDQLFPDRVGEIYHLAYSSEQRWYWAPDMRRDEVLLIKGWDSEVAGRVRFTPHSAVQLADRDTQRLARESIEARAYLVFAP